MEFANIYDDNDRGSTYDNPLHIQNENIDLRTENNELKERNAGLEGNVDDLEGENASLKEQIEKLKADKDVDTVNAL